MVHLYGSVNGIVSTKLRMFDTSHRRLDAVSPATQPPAHQFCQIENSAVLNIAFFDPSGYVTLGSTGFWVLFGREKTAYEPLILYELVVPESMLSMKRVLDTTWRVGRSGRRELQFQTREGRRFWALLQTEHFHGTDIAVAYFFDTSSLHEKEQQLQESAAMLERAQRIGHMGHWTYDAVTDRMAWSSQAAHVLLGDIEFDLAGDGAWLPIHQADRTKLRDAIQRAIAEKDSVQISCRVSRASGEQRVVYLEGDVDVDFQGQPLRIVGVVQDITERAATEQSLKDAQTVLENHVQRRTTELARANEALENEIVQRTKSENVRSELLAQLVRAQEDERSRIARELHDEMGQLHAALLLGLKSLENCPGVTQEIVDRIHYLQSLANQVGQSTHDLAAQLRPAALDDLGLRAALFHYVETWSERAKVKIDLHMRGLEGKRLLPAVESTVYRVVQEALTNVAKHAQAENVSVIIERQDQQLLVIVEDDGKGFSPEKLMQSSVAKNRLGLLGMQERMAAIGGTLEFESSRHGGTTIFARLPFIK